MKRPGLASTLWFLAFVAVLLLLARNVFRADLKGNTDIIFSSKVFYDSGQSSGDEYVYASGTLTGEGLAYPNNTVVVICYKDRRECLSYSIDQIGPNQLSRLEAPDIYPVTNWTPLEVVASGPGDTMKCHKVTISLERKLETALWVSEPVNQASAACKNADSKLHKWTIEDSPSWKDLLSRIRKP